MELSDRKDVTSEEKLLKLIRKKNPGQPSAGMPPVAPAKEEEKKTLPADGKRSSKDNIRTLKTINGLLVLFVLASGVFLVYRTMQMNEQKTVRMVKKIEADISEEASAAGALKPLKSFDYYQKKIEERDRFESPWEKTTPGDNAQSSPGLDLSKDIKLVGIVLDDNPQAIIEDLKSHQTVFLSKGGQIGDASILDIQEGKVILLYNDEKVELVP